jgi:hypothetical protein
LSAFRETADTLLEEYSSLVPEELKRLPQEKRHRVYKICVWL